MTELMRNEDVEINDDVLHEMVFEVTGESSVTEHFLIRPSCTRKHEQPCEKFLREIQHSKRKHHTTIVEDSEPISYKGKTEVPCKMQDRIASWCHDCLSHPGRTCLKKTVAQTVW